MGRALRLGLVLVLLLTAVAACRGKGPLDLPGLEGRARGGDAGAIRELVALLAVADNDVNGRAYKILIDLGPPAVPALMDQVGSGDLEEREHVIAALGNLKVRQAVPAIVGVLNNRSLGRRYVAAWALGEISDPAALPALIGALDDNDGEVRKYATRSLIKFHADGVPALLDYLPKASARGEAGAVRALGDIADKRALEPLLARVKGPNRQEVYLALGKLRDGRAEAALVAGLGDDDWRVRMNAAMALGPLGGPTAATALRTTLDDPIHVVREWSARSLQMITGQAVTYRNEKGEQVAPYSVYH